MEEQLGFREGEYIRISQKIVEGKKERVASFQGRVTKIKGAGVNRMVTVAAILDGVGVERIYPIHTPSIVKIEKIIDAKKKKVHAKGSSQKKGTKKK